MRSTVIFCLICLICFSSSAFAEDYQKIIGQKQIFFEQISPGLKTEKNPEIRTYSAREESTSQVFYQFYSWLQNLTFQGEMLGKLIEDDPELLAVVKKNLFQDFRLEELIYPEGQVKTVFIRTWNGTELAKVLDRLYREISLKPRLDQSNPINSKEQSIGNYQGYTGVIIDTRGYKVRPSMAPKIFDPLNIEVYGTMDCDLEFVIQSGIVGYAYNLEEAQKNERVGENPYIIQAVGRRGNAKDHAIIPLVEADLLRKMNQHSTILIECKVMFVIDE